jgi:hypothetical protein
LYKNIQGIDPILDSAMTRDPDARIALVMTPTFLLYENNNDLAGGSIPAEQEPTREEAVQPLCRLND